MIRKTSGFTLIELLVVIAVVGILAVVALAIINPVQQIRKSRDAGRKSTLRQLANRLEEYRIVYGRYPLTGTGSGGWYASEPGTDWDYGPGNNGDWIPGLVAGGFLKQLPRDPDGGPGFTPPTPGCSAYKKRFLYTADTNGTCYKLVANCSAESVPWEDEFKKPNITRIWDWGLCTTSSTTNCCDL